MKTAVLVFFDNATFAQTLAQALVSKGLGFTFFLDHDSKHGLYAFSFLSWDDAALQVARQLAEEWAVAIYEAQPKSD